MLSSLLELCLNSAASSIQKYTALTGLPEELTVCLFELVLEKGKLSPSVLQMFSATNHEAIIKRIKGLNLREPPPLPGGNDRWLHQKHNWY